MSIMNGNYKFRSNNVKGMKASKKRLELLEYVRNNKGNIFLAWKKQFLCCDNRLFETLAFKLVNTACDKNGRIITLDAQLNGINLLLINY